MKKLNKLFAILVAMAMVMALAVTSAFALDETVNETAAADAKLVKYLEMKEGVTIPDATFKFKFKPVATATVPAADLGEEFEKTITAAEMTPSTSNADDGALVKALNLFGTGGIFENYNFPHAGEYEFTVTETIVPGENETGTFAANTQTYTLRIYKTNTDTTVTVEGDQDKTEGDGTEKVKKDPAIADPSGSGENSKTQDEISQTKVDGFSFVNNYTQDPTKTPDDDPTNGKYGAFNAKKTTSGDYSDETARFPITISVDFGSYTGDKALNLYDKDGNAITAGNPAVEVELAQVGETTVWAATVNLAKDELAYFKNLPNGAVVTVNEDLTNSSITNAAHYYQTGITTTGDVAAAQKNGTAKDGSASDTATNFVADSMTYADANAKKVNSVVINNENKTVVEPEGILISNLPYIALALVAIGGLVAYVVIRRRNADEA